MSVTHATTSTMPVRHPRVEGIVPERRLLGTVLVVIGAIMAVGFVVPDVDRYTLADVVEVTLRKLRRDGLPLPFATSPVPNTRAAVARRTGARGKPQLDETEGVLHQLLGDYII